MPHCLSQHTHRVEQIALRLFPLRAHGGCWSAARVEHREGAGGLGVGRPGRRRVVGGKRSPRRPHAGSQGFLVLRESIIEAAEEEEQVTGVRH